MALRFTLSPAHCARFYDVLTCLSKFSDLLSIEARYSQLLLSALNSSKSAYASFLLEKDEFFTQYEFDSDLSRRDDRFSCSISNRALSSVFKGRLGDPKTGDGAVERCQAVFDDRPDGEECRLVLNLIYRQGITKTFKLTYEASDTMQAVFDKSKATNSWKASARMLRECAEHFGARTEQLDICSEDGQVTLTSYTEKIMQGKETLKQPLQTAVTIDTTDFDQFDVQDELHIAVSVKDFRSIIIHAVTLPASVSALYSVPSHPLQLSYAKEGMRCEFTLMTIGDHRGTTPGIARAVTREREVSVNNLNSEPRRSVRPESFISAPDDSRKEGKLGSRTNGPSERSQRSQPEVDPESLFVPAAETDDRQWEPADERQDEEVMLGWDASGENDSGFHATFTNSGSNSYDHHHHQIPAGRGIAPTQRASQVRGLFD